MASSTTTASAFGNTLKQWRKRRGLSQLDLSCKAGVGQRHLSFIESGRSRPGKEVVQKIAGALGLPLREQNVLLQAAGFAAPWPESRMDAEQSAPFQQMVDEMLRRQMPFPAHALDRHWNVVRANPASLMLLGAQKLDSPVNLVDSLIESRKGPDRILNLDEVLTVMAEEIDKESARFPNDPDLSLLLERLRCNIDPDFHLAPTANRPVLTVSMQVGEFRINTISTIARFFGPLEICLDELRVELVFPADETSRRFFHRVAER